MTDSRVGLPQRRRPTAGQPAARPRQQYVHASRNEKAAAGREVVELSETTQPRLLSDQGRLHRRNPAQAVLAAEPRPATLLGHLPELAPRAPARDLGSDELSQTVHEALLVLRDARLHAALLRGRAADDAQEQPAEDVALVGRDPPGHEHQSGSRVGAEPAGQRPMQCRCGHRL